MNAGEDHCFIDNRKINLALTAALEIAKRNMVKFQNCFPESCSMTGIYNYRNDIISWHEGFWGGIFWLCYEFSGDMKMRCYAERSSEMLYDIIHKRDIFHGDLGMLYIPGCVANYKLTKNEEAKEAAVIAADCQLSYYNAASSLICGYPKEKDGIVGTCKVSNLLNILLLYFAEKTTGNSVYGDVARRNADIILKHNIIDTGKVFFRAYFNFENGTEVCGKNDAIETVAMEGVSRNYAWALLGMALHYTRTKFCELEGLFDKVFNYLFARTPEDICNYKLSDAEDGQVPDSTATAIVVCGLLEMAKGMDENNPKKRVYEEKAYKLLNSLIDNYSVSLKEGNEGFLLHGMWTKKDVFRNCCTVQGDYFYLEALMRCYKDFSPCWHHC